jgi:hypothetical protein
MLSLPVITVYILVVSGFAPWFAGFSYGPRYMVGMIPWFLPIATVGLSRFLSDVRPRSTVRSVTLIMGMALLSISVWIHGRGAIAMETWNWNGLPGTENLLPEKVWDWRQPQFLAGLIRPPLPRTLALLEGRVNFGLSSADAFVWYGWSRGEESFRWSDQTEAALAFTMPEDSSGTLVIRIVPFLAPGQVDAQRLEIFINDILRESLTLPTSAPVDVALEVTREQLIERNTVIFALPDATSPQSLGISDDQRSLGVQIHWLELRPR